MKPTTRFAAVASLTLTLLTTGCGLSIGEDGPGHGGGTVDAGIDDSRSHRDVGQTDTGVDDAGYADTSVDDASAPREDTQAEPTDDAAPRILMLSTNTRRLLPGQTLIISAVVTDPDGINDLIGGVLFDAETEGTYGSFATAESEGAYSIQLEWWDLHQVRALETGSGGETRIFSAEFFDVAGHTASGEVAVDLTCENPTDALCSGHCTDVLNDVENCGGCGNDVSDFPRAACVQGVGYGVFLTTQRTSCTLYCALEGLYCATNPYWDCTDDGSIGGMEGCALWTCPAGGLEEMTSHTCDEVPPETIPDADNDLEFAMQWCSCSTVR